MKIAAGVRPEDFGVDFDALETGQLIQVSGLRRDNGLIEATRIESAPDGTKAALRGPISAIDGTGFSIGDQRVEAADAASLEGLGVGDQVFVSGTTEADALRASNVRREAARPFDGRYKTLSLEGFLGRGDGKQLRLAGHDWNLERGMEFDGMSSDQLRFGQRLIVEGELADGEKPEVTPRVVRAAQVGRSGAYAGSRTLPPIVRSTGGMMGVRPAPDATETSPQEIIGRRGGSPEPSVTPGVRRQNRSRLRIQRPVRPNYTSDPAPLPPGGRRPPRWRQRGESVRGGARVRRR